MSDPVTNVTLSLTGLAVVLFGPQVGPMAAILFCAVSGSLWPITAMEGATRTSAFFMLTRCVLTSVALTGALAGFLTSYYSLTTLELLAPVAFFLAAFGDGWKPVIAAASKALAGFLSRTGSK